MPKPQEFIVTVQVHLKAKNAEEATAEVAGLLDYAFEVSNDDGRFVGFFTGQVRRAVAPIGNHPEA